MKKILLVEDSEQDAILIKGLLADLEVELHHCADFYQALDILDEQDFDLVILDFKMPFVDGLKGLKQLRATDKYRHKPIFMLTGRSEAPTVMRAMDLGVTDFLVKPPQKVDIQNRIRKALGVP